MKKTLIKHGNRLALVIDKPILEVLQITAETELAQQFPIYIWLWKARAFALMRQPRAGQSPRLGATLRSNSPKVTFQT